MIKFRRRGGVRKPMLIKQIGILFCPYCKPAFCKHARASLDPVISMATMEYVGIKPVLICSLSCKFRWRLFSLLKCARSKKREELYK